MAGHAVFSDSVASNICEYDVVPGSDMLFGGIECWCAFSEQPGCIFSKHERIADGFKVGDQVSIQRTGFMNTSDGSFRSNKHKGSTRGISGDESS